MWYLCCCLAIYATLTEYEKLCSDTNFFLVRAGCHNTLIYKKTMMHAMKGLAIT
jgi:hypothetical protein